MFDITIYCPDTHFLYDGNLPDEKGVGGGILARIRLAQALVRSGHRVTLIANVTHPHKVAGVDFIPLSNASQKKKTDILLLVSSGGELSILPALDLKIKAKWRSVWLHGTVYIKGVDTVEWDEINPCSNFISNVVREKWPLSDPKIFTVYNGASYKKSPTGTQKKRDPYRLIYTSHPNKGLSAALSVLKILRRTDKRFHLHVYGGDGLWGGTDSKFKKQPGVTYFGTCKHNDVLSAVSMASVSFQLQSRPEPFGLVLTESMVHGTIPIASPVGAYPELVSHGQNGILVDGDHNSDEVQALAAEWVLKLNRNPEFAAYIRKKAMNIPWSWDTMAKVWAGHWEWVLKKKGVLLSKDQCCHRCGGALLTLADGYHCVDCGWYFQSLSGGVQA